MQYPGIPALGPAPARVGCLFLPELPTDPAPEPPPEIAHLVEVRRVGQMMVWCVRTPASLRQICPNGQTHLPIPRAATHPFGVTRSGWKLCWPPQAAQNPGSPVVFPKARIRNQGGFPGPLYGEPAWGGHQCIYIVRTPGIGTPAPPDAPPIQGEDLGPMRKLCVEAPAAFRRDCPAGWRSMGIPDADPGGTGDFRGGWLLCWPPPLSGFRLPGMGAPAPRAPFSALARTGRNLAAGRQLPGMPPRTATLPGFGARYPTAQVSGSPQSVSQGLTAPPGVDRGTFCDWCSSCGGWCAPSPGGPVQCFGGSAVNSCMRNKISAAQPRPEGQGECGFQQKWCAAYGMCIPDGQYCPPTTITAGGLGGLRHRKQQVQYQQLNPRAWGGDGWCWQCGDNDCCPEPCLPGRPGSGTTCPRRLTASGPSSRRGGTTRRCGPCICTGTGSNRTCVRNCDGVFMHCTRPPGGALTTGGAGRGVRGARGLRLNPRQLAHALFGQPIPGPRR